MARVLIVEDNPDLLEILHELLSGEHDVETALAGEEGIEKARAFQPGVVLMDLQLPRMSGIEAACSIKRELGPENVVIIALTALARQEVTEKVMKSGCCDAYMHKPASLDAIRSKVKELLEGRE